MTRPRSPTHRRPDRAPREPAGTRRGSQRTGCSWDDPTVYSNSFRWRCGLPAGRPDGEGPERRGLMGMAQTLVQQDVEELRGRAGRMFERALELDRPRAGPLLQRVCRAGRGETVLARTRFNQLLAQEQDPDVRADRTWHCDANEQETRVAGQSAPAAPRRLQRMQHASQCTSRWPRSLPAGCRRARRCSLQRVIPGRRDRHSR